MPNTKVLVIFWSQDFVFLSTLAHTIYLLYRREELVLPLFKKQI